MNKQLFLGAISGTSVDGLDLAVLEIASSIKFLANITTTLPPELRATLLSLGQPGQDTLDDYGSADTALGEVVGHAINKFLADEGIDKNQIAAFGWHGQTVRHRPEGRSPFTLQIGDPNRIVEITGITTIADFRPGLCRAATRGTIRHQIPASFQVRSRGEKRYKGKTGANHRLRRRNRMGNRLSSSLRVPR